MIEGYQPPQDGEARPSNHEAKNEYSKGVSPFQIDQSSENIFDEVLFWYSGRVYVAFACFGYSSDVMGFSNGYSKTKTIIDISNQKQ